MTEVRVSEHDVQSLAEKLAAFTKTLTPGELAAFELLEEQLLMAFLNDDPDVQGFDFGRLDAMGADAHRQDMLRRAQVDARAAGAPSMRDGEGRVRVWSSLLASIAGRRGSDTGGSVAH
jgi:hypothetical protein